MNGESIGNVYLEKARIPSLAVKNGGKSTGSFDAVLQRVESQKKPTIDKQDKLYEQCEALETFLIKNLLNSMRNTVEKSGLVDEGFAGKMYEDMLYDEYAKDFSKNADFGLAELAYLELDRRRSS
ncbi:putative peptidoglycan hydrolase FlgJ [Pillotina sp. SPG140]|jgi:flagellar protein FlgJ